MRRSSQYRRRNKSWGPQWESAPIPLSNANWSYGQVNLMRGVATRMPQQRIFQVTSANLRAAAMDTGSGQENSFLKKLVFDCDFTVNPRHARIGASLTAFDDLARDDVPAPGIAINSSGQYQGLLLGSGYDADNLLGISDWMVGQPTGLAMVYEDTTAAAADPAVAYTLDTEDLYYRNKLVFWRGLVTPSAYNPVRMRINKTFPGKGLSLSPGAREIYSVSLIAWTLEDGGGLQSALSFSVRDARCWFKLA